MKHWRLIALLGLLALPPLVFVGLGAWSLILSGRLTWVWWLPPVCWGLSLLLVRLWRDEIWSLPRPRPELHWTRHDEAALEIVERHQQSVRELDEQRLTDLMLYWQTANELARDLAAHYHPDARDAWGSLTVPEILTAAQLAIDDVAHWVDDYVPGSHLLTVDQWRALSRAPGYLRTASDVSWAVSVVLYPTNILRFLAARLTLGPTTKQLHVNVLTAFYMMYVRRVGHYLIEMNSGRLRTGAGRYRQLVQRVQGESPAADMEVDRLEAHEVTIVLVGQVNAGKSSVANALLGRRQAVSDVLPTTTEVDRYQLELEETRDRLTLLDTPGYGDSGATRSQVEQTKTALKTADLILLVVDATQPARAADLQLMVELESWFAGQHTLKPPPVLVVLTHIDGLSPMMQWQPPYDWRRPTGAKEQSISDAVDYNREQFGNHAAGVVPVCSDVARDRVFGVTEYLLPAVTMLLGEARACCLIRALDAETDRGQVRKVFHQFFNAGLGLAQSWVFGTRNAESGTRNK